MCCDPSIQLFLMRRQAAVAAAARQNTDFAGFEDDEFFANMTATGPEEEDTARQSPKPVPASPVGEYQCDLPVWTAESMLRNIRQAGFIFGHLATPGSGPTL